MDHSRCAHESTKAARARCRAGVKKTEMPLESSESVSDDLPALTRRLTRETACPGLWIALRRSEHVSEGYVIANDGTQIMLSVGGGICRLTWGDDFELFDESP